MFFNGMKFDVKGRSYSNRHMFLSAGNFSNEVSGVKKVDDYTTSDKTTPEIYKGINRTITYTECVFKN